MNEKGTLNGKGYGVKSCLDTIWKRKKLWSKDSETFLYKLILNASALAKYYICNSDELDKKVCAASRLVHHALNIWTWLNIAIAKEAY